ncbi:4-(cytidine 5'-diphospho)-2-C-methyl-D-erythritol kinase [Gryllotalpicola protaetiae]|uniref:4-diphosphocytidyl-2-C-methyl-D-erythritol kinase n=1 Tax=Gryllotalpicola protaetiae TaxID=2419771 RepID=A0A387BFA2_9MICO|nr:4-(cytidine 5'-diphospho)-2-C-methyl-D-erythritol kinase [Gryllotalpicola protaetiae]AYG02675.1 4-(cytidine 5'-diphospho)-2-C-methyl-D-erythritol kinase [Gryllotalpicola protaetiae]
MTEAVESGRDTRVHVRAPGKINVYLGVGEVMADGYHEVATAYQAVSLYEEVYASESSDFTVSFRGPVDCSGLPTDETNLALRAARLLATHTAYAGGVRLEIEKHVPIAGGMGGGSADAAAALVACDALWGTSVPREELHELAALLGADVPFALAGGTAIGTGRGEELSPALARGTFHWVLALPDAQLSTPAVYGELDRHRERHRAELAPKLAPSVDPAVLQALRAGDPRQLAEVLANDLQAAAIHLAPELAPVLETGERAGALAGLVSGSGPTVAFLAEDGDGALELQIALSASGLRALRVTGPVHGARVVG